MYKVLGAAFISGFICLVFTPGLVKLLLRRRYGQVIREDGPHAHFVKEGTPTMGGLLIVVGTVVAYLLMSARTPEGLVVIGTMVACGLLGFADDFIQIRKERSLGLKPSVKFLVQLVIAVGFTCFATQFSCQGYPALPAKFSFLGVFGPGLGWLLFIWVFIMLTASSNAVNLTDGLDGLATGSMIMVMAAYLLIAVTMFRHPITEHAKFYDFTGEPALDIAIIC
ncbi:MAG: phospho-N-acetylmuramoyl-pentapeptide-transferase, partial [Actinobacteria bacterium]|nr:phospho-N-acetylmuramoyl-pentapeptide-transferase [Actinomycetota bacterium]